MNLILKCINPGYLLFCYTLEESVIYALILLKFWFKSCRNTKKCKILNLRKITLKSSCVLKINQHISFSALILTPFLMLFIRKEVADIKQNIHLNSQKEFCVTLHPYLPILACFSMLIFPTKDLFLLDCFTYYIYGFNPEPFLTTFYTINSSPLFVTE